MTGHSLRSFQTGKQQIQWKHGGGDPYRPGDDLEDTELIFQPDTFFQVNPYVNEKILSEIVELV